ncbi:DUF2170 domain-containing protein [Endozoicomonas sp. OPT23]|uniref:YjfI family protein n=1 Tax=Endozoicomonas sp. OPT23 TaxID=2072845 RepID=UPI00129A736C|nr:DUF2170 family protein [Endozoicomonas sp. OPT23]MRI32914.1 DUF2170 domain-containing protein [Endozoicomonas sp. OPT23]
MDIKTLARFFEEHPTQDGYQFNGRLSPSETPVLQLQVSTLQTHDELPVYITATEQQILCIVYLWQDSEIRSETRAELMESMLELNIPMPLSSFARTGEHTVMFGALHCQSKPQDIIHEVVTLHDNALEAVQALSEYLV